LGLAMYFPVILGGDSVVRKKPQPDGLFQALELLGVRSPQRVMMVGDSVQDIVAGRAVGTRTCGVISNIGDPLLLQRSCPDYTVLSLHDLVRVVS
jgi:phosphoglycolate phosphatase-like HAD superfamily hydrolase